MSEVARQPTRRHLAQMALVPPDPHVDPGADDPDAMVLEFRLPHDDDLPRPLAGFVFFWLRYVLAFRPQYHCAGCFIGPYHPSLSATMPIPARVRLNPAHPVAYLCGVADTAVWAGNLHLPLTFAPGEQVTAETFNGVRITAHNARELPIPWIADGWNGFPLSYTTCRNWQFGIARFGYDGRTRPVEDELRSPELRTADLAAISWQRQRGLLSRQDVRTRMQTDDDDEPEFSRGYTTELLREWEDHPDW